MMNRFNLIFSFSMCLIPLQFLSAKGGGGHGGGHGHAGSHHGIGKSHGDRDHGEFGKHGKHDGHDHDHDHDHHDNNNHHHNYGNGYGGWGYGGGWNDWEYNYGPSVVYPQSYYTYPDYYGMNQTGGGAPLLPQYSHQYDPFDSSLEYKNERYYYYHPYPGDQPFENSSQNQSEQGYKPDRGVFLGD